MKSILIYGDMNAGKSTACSKLLKVLLALDGEVTSYQTYSWGDFYALVSFEGKTVAIYSAGDAKKHLMKALAFGEDNNCDVLIAVLSNGKHYNEPLAGYERDKDYFWYELPWGDEVEVKSANQNRLIVGILEKMYELLNN